MTDDDLTPDELERMLSDSLEEHDFADRRNAAALDQNTIAINWRDLPDSAARHVWLDLRDWVEWFTNRYEIPSTVVPACWWKHGRLVEELSALRAAHRVSFAQEDSGYGPISFHEKLPLALARLKEKNNCRDDRHEPPVGRDWTGKTDEQAWATWTTQAHGH